MSLPLPWPVSAVNEQFVRDFVKFTSYTEGRDKLYRVTQYASRFLLWYFTRYGGPDTTVQKVQQLEAAVTTSRKLFRMFRSMEFAQRAVDALQQTDDIQRFLTLIGFTGKALWLLIDHLVWLGRTKICDVDIKKWGQRSAWYWLVALLSLTLNDLRKIQLLTRQAEALKREGLMKSNQGVELKRDMHKARLGLMVNLSDVWIPVSVLGYVSKGLGSMGGVIASVTAIHLVWNKNVHGK
ncbi:peroxisomal membrane protein 11B-like [Asterias amurensis]|uniref:peroxisomal membrane protein 11B-like n=1 Tax=Asterias amurensis TaxID=7602 RepID=UPI003AB6693F